MAHSPYMMEVDESTFASFVLESSRRVPVLVDFWAAWCAPCQMLMPILAKLVNDYNGQFLLAKVNTDEQQSLASRYGIRSLPTVKLFKGGRAVDELMGAQPESVIRRFLDRHIERESDRLRLAAESAYRNGQVDAALSKLREAAELDPENTAVCIDLARLLLDQGRYDEAESILADLPWEAREQPAAVGIKGLLGFARVAGEAPDVATLESIVRTSPGNARARYQLSAHRVLAGDYEGALEHLLDVIRTDPGLRDDARNGMVAIFGLLGGKGDLVTRYRSRMFTAMH
jgi:putative thioredoxin